MSKKLSKKRKPPKKPTPRAKALTLLQKLVRLKAADENGICECVTSGARKHWTEMDGGHFIAKGHSSRWALDERNVHPQTKSQNAYAMKFGTATHSYTMWMIDHYGKDFVQHILDTKNDIHKLYKADYDEMIADFKEQIKEQEARLASTRPTQEGDY